MICTQEITSLKIHDYEKAEKSGPSVCNKISFRSFQSRKKALKKKKKKKILKATIHLFCSFLRI